MDLAYSANNVFIVKSTTHTLDGDQSPIKLLQVTDTHLFKENGDELLGIDTEQTFQDVIKHLKEHHHNHDAIIYTGDLAQNASETAYKKFKTYADSITSPYFCLAGNHDNPDIMGKYFAGSDSHQVVSTPYWDFVLLNSHTNNSPAGFLSEHSLEWLQSTLANSHKHIAIFLHHHPISMRSDWIDHHMLKNADAFWDILAPFTHIKAIIFGHVHQSSNGIHNGIQLFSTPSTSVQFSPKSHNFAVDDIASGYRWLKFFSDGNLETGVERLHYVPENLKLHSDGY